jgi:hypothetical protein
LPPIPINAIVSHTKLLSAGVRLLLDFFVKELARNDLLRRPSLSLKSIANGKDHRGALKTSAAMRPPWVSNGLTCMEARSIWVRHRQRRDVGRA